MVKKQGKNEVFSAIRIGFSTKEYFQHKKTGGLSTKIQRLRGKNYSFWAKIHFFQKIGNSSFCQDDIENRVKKEDPLSVISFTI